MCHTYGDDIKVGGLNVINEFKLGKNERLMW